MLGLNVAWLLLLLLVAASSVCTSVVVLRHVVISVSFILVISSILIATSLVVIVVSPTSSRSFVVDSFLIVFLDVISFLVSLLVFCGFDSFYDGGITILIVDLFTGFL